MNRYECDRNISCVERRSIQRGDAELNRTSSICQQVIFFTIARIKPFIICFIQHLFDDINVLTSPCDSLLSHGHTM